MTHDAIREAYPNVKRIIGLYPDIKCYDENENVLDLDLTVVKNKSTNEILTLFKNLVQNHLDSTAYKWGYDSIYTAITYVGDDDITYDKEGQMFKKWRSSVWLYVNQELSKLEQGLRTMPTEEEAIAELPLLDTYRQQLGL